MINTPVIDMHSHVGRWGRPRIHDDPQRYLRIMDAAGIDKSCVSPPIISDHWRANNYVADFVSAYPDRFIGVAFVTPHYPEEVLPVLNKAFDEQRMAFIKIYPDYFGKPIDDEAYFPVFNFANERGLMVKSHATFPFDPVGTTIPNRFSALSDRFPNVKWILAHAGSSDPLSEKGPQAVQAASTLEKVYLETCSSRCSYGTIEYIVNNAGADKVLYGSDTPLMDSRQEIGKILTADLSEEDKCKIIGLNAMRLLGIEF